MTETIRYTRIGREDIALEPRGGSFEVELADGRRVIMHALDIAYMISDAYAKDALPSPATINAGRLARVTDDVKGLWIDDGAAWQHLAPQEVDGMARWDITGLQTIGDGPYAWGSPENLGYKVTIGGEWTPLNGGQAAGLLLSSTIHAARNQDAALALISSGDGIQRASEGTHPFMAGLWVDDLRIAAGGALITDAATFYVANSPTTPTGLAHQGIANLYPMWIAGTGNNRMDSDGTNPELMLNRTTAGPGAQIVFKRNMVAKAGIGIGSDDTFTFFDASLNSTATVSDAGLFTMTGLVVTSMTGPEVVIDREFGGGAAQIAFKRFGLTQALIGLTEADGFAIYDSVIHEIARFTGAKVLKLAGTFERQVEGTNHLDIFDGTPPSGTLGGGISLFSTVGELHVLDAAGNNTLLSPHNHEGEWVFDSTDTVHGRRLVIQMERMMKALNAHFGWDYVSELCP